MEKLNLHVHVKDSFRVPSQRASPTRHWPGTPSRFSRSVADTVVEDLTASSIWKKKTNASERGERSWLSLSVIQIYLGFFNVSSLKYESNDKL